MTDQNHDNDLIFLTNGEEKFRFSGDGPWKSQAPAKKLKVTTKLSPAAQAVLIAAESHITAICCSCPGLESALSAALRAAADQVVPSDADEPRNNLSLALECQRIRIEFLAIATELESQ